MKTPTNQPDTYIDLDRDLRAFLRECVGGQCLAIAAWAKRLLDADRMTEKDLERCLNLGFEF